MGTPEIVAGIAIFTLVINILYSIWDRAQRRATVDASIERAVITTQNKSSEEALKINAEMAEGFERLRREFGETSHAIREKVRDVEFFVRDKFISKETFNLVIERDRAEFRGDVHKLEAQVERVNNKLDKLVWYFKVPDPPNDPKI